MGEISKELKELEKEIEGKKEFAAAWNCLKTVKKSRVEASKSFRAGDIKSGQVHIKEAISKTRLAEKNLPKINKDDTVNAQLVSKFKKISRTLRLKCSKYLKYSGKLVKKVGDLRKVRIVEKLDAFIADMKKHMFDNKWDEANSDCKALMSYIETDRVKYAKYLEKLREEAQYALTDKPNS